MAALLSVSALPALTETVRQVPSCVWSCPAGARVFGDLNDPASRVNALIREREGAPLLEEVGTRPSVSYLPSRRKRPL